MSDVEKEKLRLIEMENAKLKDENVKLRRVIGTLNQTVNRMIQRYISVNSVA